MFLQEDDSKHEAQSGADYSRNVAIRSIWAFLAYLLDSREESVRMLAPFSLQLLTALCSQLSKLRGRDAGSIQLSDSETECSLLSLLCSIATRCFLFVTFTLAAFNVCLVGHGKWQKRVFIC